MGQSTSDQWFVKAFEADYLHRYAHRTDAAARAETPFLISALKIKRGARVLDLCCGAGRHSRALAASGMQVVGVDLSADLLLTASFKPSGRKRIGYVRADMRRLPLQSARFDAGVNLFTSFGYFTTEQQNERALSEAVRVLKTGARFVLDFMNIPYVVKHLVAESERTVDCERIVERRWYDRKRGRLIKTAHGTACGKPIERFESVRAYTPAELAALFKKCGLRVVARYGGLKGEAFKAGTSPRCVLVGEKRGA
jgi:ubiquinone/menaquinone biosynthesis C-methylase UbiE